MKKQITMVISLGIIISFAAGLFIGWLIPLNIIPSTGEQIVPGERSHLIGSWKGPTGDSTFSMSFFENGSLLFSSYMGNFTVNQDQLVLHDKGISISAQYFFIGDYDTLGLRNIQGNSTFPLSFFGTPYGIILQRA
jgi:hypothetical protein